MLANLFNRKPKWQHQDEEVRCRALRDLADATIRRRLLESDPSVRVRVTAVECEPDAVYLLELLTRGQEVKVRVREALRERLAQMLLLEQATQQAIERLESALHQLASMEEQPLLGRVASDARLARLRAAACLGLVDEELLERIVLQDAVAEVRRAALERIQSRELLGRLHKALRKRDKQLARIARERQQQRAEAEQRPLDWQAERERLLQSIDRLGRTGQWRQDDAHLEYLGQRWARLCEDYADLLEDAHQSAFEQALAAYAERASAFHADQARQQAQAERADQLESVLAQQLVQLQTLVDRGEQLDPEDEAGLSALREGFVRCQEDWRQLLEQGGDLCPATMVQQGEQLLGALAERLQLQYERLEAATLLERRLDQLQRRLDAQQPDLREIPAQLQRLRQGLASLGKGERREQLRARLDQLEQRLERLQDKRARQQQRLLEGLPAWLEALQGEIETGNSGEANQLFARVQEALKQLDQAGRGHDCRDARDRFNQLRPAFDQLRQWRDWAVDNEREVLCQEMEALPDAALPAETLAQQIQQLQGQWKRLDATRARASGELWQRFSDAAERAYQPVRELREQQALARSQHAEQRRALLEEIAGWLAAQDWEAADWKQIQQQQREYRNRWREQGQVTHADWKLLNSDFLQLMDQFEARLAPERERNLRHRQRLLERMQQLIELEDLDQATREARDLQRKWQVSVAGRRGAEQALWQKFSAAADQVYARRQARQAEQQTHWQQQGAAAEQLLAEFEQRLDAATETTELRTLGDELAQRWSELGELPRDQRKSLQQRQRQWLDQLAERLEQHRQAAHRAQRLRMAELAAACDALETALRAEDAVALPGLLETLGARDLTGLPSALVGRCRSLCELAEPVVADGSGLSDLARALTGASQENAERKSMILLQLEIRLGLESPAAEQQRRMQLRVEQLSEAMREGEDQGDELDPLLADWYACGLASSEVESELAPRIQAVLDQLLDQLDPA